MEDFCFKGIQSLPDEARGGVVTIGNFDGVHRGHQSILETARRRADAEGVPVVAVTFEPPPDQVLRPCDAPERLTPPEEKCRHLRHAGADWVFFACTDTMLLAMAPEEFVDRFLVSHFAPRHVVEGPNFFFGLSRSGNVETLRQAGRTRGFHVEVVEPVGVELPDGTHRVSSTLIRSLLHRGRVEDAATCLGRDFILFGRIVHGHGRGRGLSFPTANIESGDQVLPGDGVYAGTACVGCCEYLAAISVGTKPTFGPEPRTVEAYLLDAQGDLYDKEIALNFRRRLRDQKRYDRSEDLKAEMENDVRHVRELLG